MSERTRGLLRGGVRATVGVLVIGVAATAAVVLNAAPLPAVEREPVAVRVDTLHGAEQSLVCGGSFAELGADPSRPGVAVPSGTAAVTLAGAAASSSQLERSEPGGSLPEVVHAPAGEPTGAAQRQSVSTAALRGLAASSCAEASNEQWLLGGATSLGISTTVNLGNPSAVPATVQLTIFDERGRVDESSSGVLVPAGSERTVSLNGYAPGRERIAVRVVSTGAAVTASLGVAQTDTLTSFAVDTVTRQLAPSRTLVFPGVANISDHQHGPGDAGELDPFPVVVRALAPGGESGTAVVRALKADGGSVELGVLEFGDGAVAELPIAHWPEDANAVTVEADAPLVGGVLGSADNGVEHDYAWFAPAPLQPAETEVAAPVVPGGRLVLVNPGTAPITVTITGEASGRSSEATVPAGGALLADAAGGARLEGSGAFVAGVRVTGDGDIAGYPILAAVERASSITVYPR